MSESAQESVQTLTSLLVLHQRLLGRASDELALAFDAISESVGAVLEDDSISAHADKLVAAVISLQAADSVTQRLAHVEQGLAFIERGLVSELTEVDPVAIAAMPEQTSSLFTIADERAIYASVFDDDLPSEAIVGNLDDPDLFLFDSPPG